MIYSKNTRMEVHRPCFGEFMQLTKEILNGELHLTTLVPELWIKRRQAKALNI
jgi:hypothetical protein